MFFLSTSLILSLTAFSAAADDGVFVRFLLKSPAQVQTTYFVRIGGYIHREPWYLQAAVVPEGAPGTRQSG